MTRGLVVAGVASGVGKTTLTHGLLEAFRRHLHFGTNPDFARGFVDACAGARR